MQTFKKLTSLSLIFILASSFLPLSGSMLQNIDQTYQILPQEDKKFSITNGAIAWETGWLNNFHRFGDGPNIHDNMSKLVQILFYRVPNSTSFADFSTTKWLRPEGPEAAFEVARLIANIVVSLDALQRSTAQSKQDKAKLDALIKKIKDDEKLGQQRQIKQGLVKLEATIKKFEETGSASGLRHVHKALFTGKKSPFVSEETAELRKAFDAYVAAQDDRNAWLTHAKALLKLAPGKFLDISPAVFANVVVGALHESNPKNPDALYPEGLVHMIWLGFLYKAIQKSSENDAVKNRIAMQIYYDTLGPLLDKRFYLPFETTLPSAIKPLDAVEEAKRFLQNADLGLQQLDSFLFYAVKSRLFPMLIGYTETNYKPFSEQKEPFVFQDCMENSIANFIRTMSYDLDTGTYNLSTLEQRFGIKLTAHKDALEQFLKEPLDHDFWTSLVSNIPYVPYIQAGTKKGESLDRGDKRAFMRVDAEVKGAYKNNGYYTIISSNAAAFELRPSLRTILIVLNHLLDLNLFENNLAKEGLRSDFVAHYFKELCNKLHLTGYYSLNPEADAQDENIDIDRIDQEGKDEEKVYSFFSSLLPELHNQALHHIFSTVAKHGTYEFLGPEIAQKLEQFYNFADYSTKLQPTGSNLDLTLLRPYLFSLSIQFPEINSNDHYTSLFSLPLYNNKFMQFFLYNTEYLPNHPNTINLLLSAANSLPNLQGLFLLAKTPVLLSRKLYKKIQDEALKALMNPQVIGTMQYNAQDALVELIKKNRLTNPPDVISQSISLFNDPNKITSSSHILNSFIGENLAVGEIITVLNNLPKKDLPQVFNLLLTMLFLAQPSSVKTIFDITKIVLKQNPDVVLQSEQPLKLLITFFNSATYAQLTNEEKQELMRWSQFALDNIPSIANAQQPLRLLRILYPNFTLEQIEKYLINAFNRILTQSTQQIKSFVLILDALDLINNAEITQAVAQEAFKAAQNPDQNTAELGAGFLIKLALQQQHDFILDFLKQMQSFDIIKQKEYLANNLKEIIAATPTMHEQEAEHVEQQQYENIPPLID